MYQPSSRDRILLPSFLFFFFVFSFSLYIISGTLELLSLRTCSFTACCVSGPADLKENRSEEASVTFFFFKEGKKKKKKRGGGGGGGRG